VSEPATEVAGLPVLRFEDAGAWERWLEARGGEAPGLWLRLAKKAAPLQSLSYAEALDVALCWGWIDGQKRGYDEHSWLQKFTPRRAKSVWSKINREKVHALTESGRMRPAGLAAVEAAKADGRWDAAYDSQRTATVPDDLAAALEASPAAKAGFEALNGANRYAILWRVQTAKRAETRARNIEKFVAMLERGETIHP
jgi:uncharacterized protein YdeI (YjbR/CyaY-like superfamily)